MTGSLIFAETTRLRLSVSIFLLVLIAGCETADLPPIGPSAVEDTEERVERWGCGDYFDGCFFRCPVTLVANIQNGTGTVKIAGVTEDTRFEIQGIERRWDWCLADDFRYDCAFVISPDGDGRYFNFRATKPDAEGARRTKPSEVFKCRRR